MTSRPATSPVWHLDLVPPDADDDALGELLAADDGPARCRVGEPRSRTGGLRLVHALATERFPATAVTGWPVGLTLDRSIAAAISPLNNGCGLVGLDRNSG